MYSAPTASSCNVEQKFRCHDLSATCTAALAAGAIESEVLQQRDVYFQVPRGRLKLRWIDSDVRGVSHELIAYERPDSQEERTCSYRIVPVSEPNRLEVLLASALGIRAIISKRRQLLLSANLRIHLDDVDDLGQFVEFEAVLGPSHTESHGRDQISHWRRTLELHEAVSASYVDLIDRAPPFL